MHVDEGLLVDGGYVGFIESEVDGGSGDESVEVARFVEAVKDIDDYVSGKGLKG